MKNKTEQLKNYAKLKHPKDMRHRSMNTIGDFRPKLNVTNLLLCTRWTRTTTQIFSGFLAANTC